MVSMRPARSRSATLGLAMRSVIAQRHQRAAADLAHKSRAARLPLVRAEHDGIDFLAQLDPRVAAGVVDLVHVRLADDDHVDVARRRTGLARVTPSPGPEQVRFRDALNAA